MPVFVFRRVITHASGNSRQRPTQPMTDLIDLVSTVFLSLFTLAASLVAAAHAILGKRDVRSAIGWVGLILLVPLIGAALYGLFGINRIRRRATELRPQRWLALPQQDTQPENAVLLDTVLPEHGRHLVAIANLVSAITPAPLTVGNSVTPLDTGEVAFGEMLNAISRAKRTVGMSSYIFDNDAGGHMFASTLAEAVRRGVEVRVLIDGAGAHYSFPTGTSRLRRLGVPVTEFLPTFMPLHVAYSNLRNHRKLLIVDGRVGFTGGMNVRGGYLRAATRRQAVRDIHFRLEGPVVSHLAHTFASDWTFCTREVLAGSGWFPALSPRGDAAARGIATGPDEDQEQLKLTMLGALARAETRVRIVSPYFLPDNMLITSLALAAMRGVDVEILIPERSNLRLVQWASWAQLGWLIGSGCTVLLTPPPFDHTKAMTVDGLWSMIGSANWDERSLRLNFEFNVECYGAGVASALDALIDQRKASARRVTREEVDNRSLAQKLRDGTAWLASPYL
jgi:cardiolipin synthase A/B